MTSLSFLDIDIGLSETYGLQVSVLAVLATEGMCAELEETASECAL